MVAVNGRHAARARKHDRSGGVIGEVPEFLAVGQIETPEVIAHLIISVEQIDLAVFDDGSAEASANTNSP